MEVRKIKKTLNKFEPKNNLKLKLKYQSVGIGKYHQDKLISHHVDGTKSYDATEEYIKNNFGIDYKHFCI